MLKYTTEIYFSDGLLNIEEGCEIVGISKNGINFGGNVQLEDLLLLDQQIFFG